MEQLNREQIKELNKKKVKKIKSEKVILKDDLQRTK